jgi:hypothetical protein
MSWIKGKLEVHLPNGNLYDEYQVDGMSSLNDIAAWEFYSDENKTIAVEFANMPWCLKLEEHQKEDEWRKHPNAPWMTWQKERSVKLMGQDGKVIRVFVGVWRMDHNNWGATTYIHCKNESWLVHGPLISI